MKKTEKLFKIKYSEHPRYIIRVFYKDNTYKDFDNEEWNIFKGGIKKNLYNKGLLNDLKKFI